MFSIIQVGDVLVSSEVLTERFCCDLEACHGECCVEGDAGAPVTLDEVAAIEDALDEVWPELSASAQAVIDRQGVAYTDVRETLDEHCGRKGLCVHMPRWRLLSVCAGACMACRSHKVLQTHQLCAISHT